MKKNKKLLLQDLKLQSFVTKFDDNETNTAKGGNGSSPYTVCCFEDDTIGCTERLRCISLIPPVC